MHLFRLLAFFMTFGLGPLVSLAETGTGGSQKRETFSCSSDKAYKECQNQTRSCENELKALGAQVDDRWLNRCSPEDLCRSSFKTAFYSWAACGEGLVFSFVDLIQGTAALLMEPIRGAKVCSRGNFLSSGPKKGKGIRR